MQKRTITLSEIRDLNITRQDIIDAVLDQIGATENIVFEVKDLDPFELKQARACVKK